MKHHLSSGYFSSVQDVICALRKTHMCSTHISPMLHLKHHCRNGMFFSCFLVQIVENQHMKVTETCLLVLPLFMSGRLCQCCHGHGWHVLLTCRLCHESTFFCSALVKTKAIWPHPKEPRFENTFVA